MSDEYQTDYDEEAVESNLSDFTVVTPEEEETDTVDTVCFTTNMKAQSRNTTRFDWHGP